MMDTSAYLGILEQRPDAQACAASLHTRRFPRYVTSTVIVEAHRRLLFDYGYETADRFLGCVYAGETIIVRPTQVDESEAVTLLRKYPDLRITLCDALTMTVMLRLGVIRAFTYDCVHFWAVGLIAVPPLDM
jgi:predicted nucleic acid-binding protein